MKDAVVVMGVSGAGKSTLGQALAEALGWRFIEGDALHPSANIAKMAAGVPLDDDDRKPFLEAVAGAMVEAGEGVVATCSSLKRRYRDLIRTRTGEVVFVLPMLDRDQLLERMQHRTGHFMPASLLDSQLADLERPGPDEQALLVEGAADLETQVAAVVAALRAQGSEAA